LSDFREIFYEDTKSDKNDGRTFLKFSKSDNLRWRATAILKFVILQYSVKYHQILMIFLHDKEN